MSIASRSSAGKQEQRRVPHLTRRDPSKAYHRRSYQCCTTTQVTKKQIKANNSRHKTSEQNEAKKVKHPSRCCQNHMHKVPMTMNMRMIRSLHMFPARDYLQTYMWTRNLKATTTGARGSKIKDPPPAQMFRRHRREWDSKWTRSL